MVMYEQILGKLQPDWLAWGDTSLDRSSGQNSVERNPDATVVMNATETASSSSSRTTPRSRRPGPTPVDADKEPDSAGRIFVSANCFKTIDVRDV